MSRSRRQKEDEWLAQQLKGSETEVHQSSSRHREEDDEERRKRRRERRKRREKKEAREEREDREERQQPREQPREDHHSRNKSRGDDNRPQEDRRRERGERDHRERDHRERDHRERDHRDTNSQSSSKQEQPPTVVVNNEDEDEDEYGEAFDSYEEEEFEMEDPAPSSPTVTSNTTSTTNDTTYGTKTSSSSSSASTMRFPESKSSSSRNSTNGRSGTFTVVHTTAPTKTAGAPEDGASGWKPGPNPRRARRVQLHRVKVGSLEAISTRLLDLPPLGKMDMYVRRLGARSIKQVAQSTSDDVRSMESQTDDITTNDVSAQVPDDLGYGSSSASNVVASSSTTTENGSSGQSVAASARQAMGLTNFLRLAGGLVETLLEENNMENVGRHQRSGASSKEGNESAASPSAATMWMGTASGLEYLQNRPVVSISSAETTKQGTSSCVVTIHGPKGQSRRGSKEGRDQFTIERKDSSFVASLASKSLLCVWNVTTPSSKSVQYPMKTMICEGVPQCCVLSPGLGSIVVAGTEEGTLALWDLSEPANLHHSDDAITLKIRDGLRRPTYTTDALTFRDSGVFSMDHGTTGKRNRRRQSSSNANELKGNQHRTPVVAVRLLQDNNSGRSSSNNGGAGGNKDTNAMSFQLATLEEAGVVMLWTVLKLKRGDPAGSETDLGLGIGGRVKLVRSARINVLNNVAEEVTAMSFCSNDMSRFYVGTLSGRLLHESRYSTVLSPREYEAGEHTQTSSVCCMATTQHSAMGDYFLVGRTDGSMSMYHAEESTPIAVWDDTCTGAANEARGGFSGADDPGDTKWSSIPRSIVKIVWASWRPSLFWVLDSGGRLHSWDLLINSFGPIGQVDRMTRDRTNNSGNDGSPELLDVVLCRERTRASLVALCRNGEIGVRQLDSTQMRVANDDDIENLKIILNELQGFVM